MYFYFFFYQYLTPKCTFGQEFGVAELFPALLSLSSSAFSANLFPVSATSEPQSVRTKNRKAGTQTLV